MITLILDQKSKVPLYEQIYKYVKDEINSGKLNYGDKLPSKRGLSEHLKVSQITVEGAYAQLVSEGYLIAKQGSGYYVALKLNEAIPMREKEKTIIFENPQDEGDDFLYDFDTSGVDSERFPFSTWAKLTRAVLNEESEKLLQNTFPQGVLELRQELCKYLYSYRGMEVSPSQIVVGAGSEYLINIILQLLGRSRIYGLENPGYPKIQKIFQANGALCIPIETDREGINPESFRNINISAIHICPSHHFPLGTIMPINRRRAVLRWAYEEANRYIIEDDYDSEFCLAGRPIPALKTIDTHDSVIYMNTFSKSLAPSLRISYLVLPPELVELYNKNFSFYSSSVSVFEQYTLSKFLSDGYFERHINRMRKIYRTKIELIKSELTKSSLINILKIEGDITGLNFLLKVTNGMSEKQLVERALQYKVRLNALSSYYTTGSHGSIVKATKNPLMSSYFSLKRSDNQGAFIVMGYSGISTDDIPKAIKALEKAWLI